MSKREEGSRERRSHLRVRREWRSLRRLVAVGGATVFAPLFLHLLVGHVVPDGAADRRAKQGVVMRQMARHPADYRPLQAALGVRCPGRGRGDQGESENEGDGLHRWSFRRCGPRLAINEGDPVAASPGSDGLGFAMADVMVGGVVVLFRQEPHGLQGRHTAHAGGGDRLPVNVVGDVARGPDPLDGGGGRARDRVGGI